MRSTTSPSDPAMRRSLAATEEATARRMGHLPLDFAAQDAVLSLHRAANSVRSHLTGTVLRRHDLTWTGFRVLWLLWLWGRLETREVAELVGISKATLTGVTTTLTSRGLVRRTSSTQDRRLVELDLTERGEHLMTEIFPEFNSVESDLVAELSPESLTTLTAGLRRLVGAVENRAGAH